MMNLMFEKVGLRYTLAFISIHKVIMIIIIVIIYVFPALRGHAPLIL